MDELATGRFQEVIDDTFVDKKKAKKVAFCNGKLYYDLLQAREDKTNDDVALVRVEQLYPFPEEQLNAVVASYPNCKEFCWVQEEPENMGAWGFILRKWKNMNLTLISRHESGSPASGSIKRFQQRQNRIIDTLFNS